MKGKKYTSFSEFEYEIRAVKFDRWYFDHSCNYGWIVKADK